MEPFSLLKDVSLLKDIVVPGSAALLAVWIATRKFKKEQLWKEKYLSYQGVFRSLEAIAHWASETQSRMQMMPTAGTKNIAEEYPAAQREVSRQVIIGPVLLSQEFCDRLGVFTDELYTERFNAADEHYDDPRDEDRAWADHAGKIYAIVERHLPALIKLARSDLGA